MLNNFRNLQSLLWSHGSRWLWFRVGYALRKRTGLIRLQMPAYDWKDRPLGTWLKREIPLKPAAYAEWRKSNSPEFFFHPFRAEIFPQGERGRDDRGGAGEAQFPGNVSWNTTQALKEANRILSGEIRYFSHTHYKTGFPPDWHRDPVTGIALDSHQHWSEISDDPGLDIKFIWEPGRFGMVYPLVRAYASTRDERYAQTFWELVRSWADSNPPNTGPHWMDGQEAALRLMAWTFGFYAFMESPATTPERVVKLAVMVAAHAERIYRNIGFAISTHSNHAISEAAGLWLTGLLYPELKDAAKYLELGAEMLEREAAAQIFPDGTYAMYSLNYHRFVLHMYLYVLRLGEINHLPFSTLTYRRIEASIEFLAQLIDPQTGHMPVYGSNDGALVLPLNDCDFTDYRPLLQLGSYLTKKKFLFEPGPWDEDVFWLYGDQTHTPVPSPLGRKAGGEGASSFPYGGIHLLRSRDSNAVIRCTDFRSRPSHADQLHVDLWIRGRNIACDAGTYLYSGPGFWRNGLASTAVHNTVTVDHLDQMTKLTRFTWTDWSKGRVIRHDERIWQGEHDGYSRLGDPVRHKRTVLSLGDDRWLVVDHLSAYRPHHYALHWLLCNGEYGVQEPASAFGLWLRPAGGKPADSDIAIQSGLLEGNAEFSIVRADPDSRRGWRSRYYGHKEPAISMLLEAEQPRAVFWTFFGFEQDVLRREGQVLHIGGQDRQTQIDLYSPEQDREPRSPN